MAHVCTMYTDAYPSNYARTKRITQITTRKCERHQEDKKCLLVLLEKGACRGYFQKVVITVSTTTQD